MTRARPTSLDGGLTWNGEALATDNPEMAALPGVEGVNTGIDGVAGAGDVVLALVHQSAAVPNLEGLMRSAGVDLEERRSGGDRRRAHRPIVHVGEHYRGRSGPGFAGRHSEEWHGPMGLAAQPAGRGPSGSRDCSCRPTVAGSLRSPFPARAGLRAINCTRSAIRYCLSAEATTPVGGRCGRPAMGGTGPSSQPRPSTAQWSNFRATSWSL